MVVFFVFKGRKRPDTNLRESWFETPILGRQSMPTASPENQGRRM